MASVSRTVLPYEFYRYDKADWEETDLAENASSCCEKGRKEGR